MIFITGITIAFFLEFLLLSKKVKVKADIILAFWLFFIGLHLFLFYLHYSGISSKYPVSIGLMFPLPLVHGPFLYLYVSSLTNQLVGKKLFQYIHFVPPFLIYLYLIKFFILPASQKIYIMSTGEGYHAFSLILWILIIISGICYVTLSQITLYKHRRNIKDAYSNIEKINLNWLQYIIIGIGIIWTVILSLNLIFSDLLGIKNLNTDLYIYASVVLFVCFLGFFGLKQTNVFLAQPIQISDLPYEKTPIPAEFIESEKYAKSGLKEIDAELIHRRLLDYMEHEKPYLDSNISLSILAERFDLHPNYLSQVINEREKKNLYDFINGYRIEEFKRMISDPKKRSFTILALAYDCGFNSKSAFNNCFKKATGQTPSEYIRLKK